MKLSEIQNMEMPTADEASKMPPMQALCQFWPLIVMALKLVKIFTGSKADAKIDSVIEWGHTSCDLFMAENSGDKGSGNQA